MQVLIRADASTRMGTGHVARCLTLATALRERGHTARFLCRPLPGNLIDRVEATGFPVVVLELADSEPDPRILFSDHPQPDWLIVDHYDMGASWESQWRGIVGQILVIDDLADRPHDCDLLVDQNADTPTDRYSPLVPEHCRVLLGPAFALLRPEFRQIREQMPPRDGRVRKILVSLGGADPNQATLTVLKGLSLTDRLGTDRSNITVDVIVGPANPNPEAVERETRRLGFTCHHNVPDMARRMAEADLFLGAGGTTTWERLALGLPGIVVSIAENHRLITQQLAEAGYQTDLGPSETVTPEQIAEAVAHVIRSPDQNRSVSQKGMARVDGLGTERVCDALMGQHCGDRLADRGGALHHGKAGFP